MHPSADLNAIAASLLGRHMRASASSLMHAARMTLIPLLTTASSIRATLTAAAALGDPVVMTISTQDLAVETQRGGIHASPTAGARALRAAAATDEYASLCAGEPLLQRSAPVCLLALGDPHAYGAVAAIAACCAAPPQDAVTDGWVPTPNCG